MQLRFAPALALATLVAAACGAAGGTEGANDTGGPAVAGNTGKTNGGGGTGGSNLAGAGGTGVVSAGGSGQGPSDGDACLKSTTKGSAIPSVVVFQLDSSGSMNCSVAEKGCLAANQGEHQDSRWNLFRKTLVAALDQLPPDTATGLMHYPVTFACAKEETLVPVGPVSTAKGAMAQALSTLKVEGITPTHDAVLAAHAIVGKAPQAGPRNVVLATDGQATTCLGCNPSCKDDALAADDAQLVADAKARAEAGTRTFVIGVQGSDAYRTILSRVARAGGTATDPACSDTGPVYCHFDLTDPSLDFSASLAKALASITGQVLSCTFDVPKADPSTFDPNAVNVRLTEAGKQTSFSKDPAHQDGWDYVSGGAQIQLYGPACDAVKAAKAGQVDLLFGCPTVVK